VHVRVDRWRISIYQATPLTTIPLAISFCLLSQWWLGDPWVGLLLAVLLLTRDLLQNRYLIVEADLSEDLRLSYLGGRERVVDASAVRLATGSAWRVLCFGAIPVVRRTGSGIVGAFYPTLGRDDLDALERRLAAAGPT
jgi:hypothetical protein